MSWMTTNRSAGGFIALIAAMLVVTACLGSSASGPSSGATASGTSDSQGGATGGVAGASATAVAATSPRDLVVFAASSLRDALAAAATHYEAADPGIHVALSFGASSTLRAQIEQGAPADLFASADTSNPQVLATEGLTDGPPVAFASNRLAIIVPADNPAHIHDPYDLARPGVRIVAAAAGVPITEYADRLIVNLQAYRGAQADLPNAIARNVVSREENVAAVVAKVALGEADAAIVYASDARSTNHVAQVPIPEQANVRATYAAVVVKASAQTDVARGFLTWLTGPDGQTVLGSFGFLPPPSP